MCKGSPHRGELGRPPGGVDVPPGIKGWAECAQWREEKGHNMSVVHLPDVLKSSRCGLFTSEVRLER